MLVIPTLLGAVAVLAASLSIPPMISGTGWFWPTVEVVLVIWLIGVGARMARVPAILVVLLQILGVSVALTALFTVGGIGGVLPNGAALTEAGELMTGAWEQIRTTVSPAPSSVELSFLICLAVGTTALIVDALIAVCRAPALVALPLLCIYSIPASIDLSMLPWEAFVAPAICYALLLTAGGLTGRQPGAGAGVARVTTGVALATLATVVGLVASGAVPGVGTAGRLPRTATGPGTSIGLSPFASLQGSLERADPIDMLRVSGLDGPHYLRTVGLQKWTTGQGWSVDELIDGRLPTVADPAPQQPVTVMSLAYRDRFLPIYNGTSAISGADPGWSYDSALQSVHRPDAQSPTPYQLSVDFTPPTAEQLRADTVTAGGVLTDSGQLPDEVVQTAKAVTGAATTAFDKAEALRAYFTNPINGFVYSLTVPTGDSGDALVDFLRNKQGFCEQYASAMAVMLRAVGVPARVAIGFTQGTKDTDGSYLISSNDAHAWVEVLFDNAGWVQFDPTPLGGGQGGQQGFADNQSTAPTSSAAPSAGVSGGLAADNRTIGAGNGGSTARPTAGQQATGGPTDDGGGGAVGVWLTVLGLLLVAVAAAVPVLVRQGRRRSRLATADGGGPGAAVAAWQEIEDLAIDHGLGLNAAESARATANRLARSAHLTDQGRAELRAVVTEAERSWYGGSWYGGGDAAGGDRRQVGRAEAERGAASGAVGQAGPAVLEHPRTESGVTAVGNAARTMATELRHTAPLSSLDRLVPRSVRPSWWRD